MFSLALLAGAAAAAAAFTPPDGEVLSYIRTNTDGTFAEDVVVYDRAPDEVWVHKSREACTNAAFVTGRLDPATGQARELVGGRLTRELTQAPFFWMTYDGDGQLRARLGSPTAEPIFTLPAHRRWVLYDFDFSDIIAHPPAEIAARRDFAFDFPLLLTGDDQPSFANLGRLTLTYAGDGGAGEGAFIHYIARGAPLGQGEGRLWFAPDGRLIDAILPLANHSEYTDFRLRLVGRAQGEAAWTARMARHWQGCPAPAD